MMSEYYVHILIHKALQGLKQSILSIKKSIAAVLCIMFSITMNSFWYE